MNPANLMMTDSRLPFAFWLAAIVGLALAGCARPGVVYQVPIADAHAALERSDVPRIIFGGAQVEVQILEQGPSRVIWQINEGGAEQLHFTADLAAVDGQSTLVTIAVAGPDSGPHVANKQRLDSAPTIVNLYATAMEEQVASVLEHRAFEKQRLYPALGVATFANLPTLSHEMGEAGVDQRHRERANMENGYANAAKSH